MKKALSLMIIIGAVGLLSGCGDKYVQPTSGTNIIAFGDSLTEGYGLEEDESYPTQLAEVLRRDVVNAGVSGDTTTEALLRLDEEVLSRDPRIVIVLLGGNDALQRVAPDITFSNLETIIDRVQSVGSGVILVGVRGGIHNAAYKKRFGDLAKEKNIPYVEDVLKGIFGKRDLMYDGIHPNKEGYAIFVQRLAPVVQEFTGE